MKKDRRAGKNTRSANNAADRVIMPIEAKIKWSRESLNKTVPNPETKMMVVKINAVPTPVNALRIASENVFKIFFEGRCK